MDDPYSKMVLKYRKILICFTSFMEELRQEKKEKQGSKKGNSTCLIISF